MSHHFLTISNHSLSAAAAAKSLQSDYSLIIWFSLWLPDEESKPIDQKRLGQAHSRPRDVSDKSGTGPQASQSPESASWKLCELCAGLSICGMNGLHWGPPSLMGLSGSCLTYSCSGACLETAAWRRGSLFHLTSSWPEGLSSFIWPPGILFQLMPRSTGMKVWGAVVWHQYGPT